MENVNFGKLRFIARPNTLFVEGKEAFIRDSESIKELNEGYECTAFFEGPQNIFFEEIGEEKEEGWSTIFEFDWIDEEGNVRNSNIPILDNMFVIDQFVIEDTDTGIRYDWGKNRNLSPEISFG